MRARPWLLWALPVVLLLAITLPHLGQGAFRADSGWYAALGLEAWRTGRLWTLHAEPGVFYFNKPPLALWVHGLFLRIGGANLVAARLPSVLAAAGCVAVAVSLAHALAGRRAAAGAGVVLATSYEFFRRTREVSLDLWQLLFILGALWLAAAAVKERRHGLLALAGVPLGLALLCKPLAALLVVPILAAWLVLIGRARAIVWLAAMLGVALAVAAPWHISMALKHPAFVHEYFGVQVGDRLAGRLGAPNHGASDPLYYVKLLGATYWPWLIGLAIGLWVWLGRRLPPRESRAVLLGVLWAGAWLAAISLFADKRPRYALPLYPAMAIIAGIGLGQAARRLAAPRRVHNGLARITGVVTGTAIIFSAMPARIQRPDDPQWPALFAWLRQHAPARPIWQGGFEGDKGARLYLELGAWPVTTRNHRGEFIAAPPAGALLIYHARSDLGPGEGESVVFTHSDLTVTRLDADRWRPVAR